MNIKFTIFSVSWMVLIPPSWLHYVDRLSHYHNVDPSAVVFPSSVGSPFSTANRVQQIDGNVDLQMEYLHAVEALFAVTTRLKTLLGRDTNKNVLVSPVSTTTALGEILLGARGESRRQLLDMLTTVNRTSGIAEATVIEFHQQLGALIKLFQNSKDYDDAYQLEIAGALFLNPHLHLHPDFNNAVTNFYGVDIEPMDFSGDPTGSLNAINMWASRHTRGVINKVFSEPLPKSTAVVLTNSIYFKGDWETPFDPKFTIQGKFKCSETREVYVNFMRGEMELMYVNSSRLGCRMIAVPYKRAKAAMYIILPDTGNLYDIHSFTASLSIRDVRELINTAEPEAVTLVMPKMTLTQSYSLKKALSDFQKQVGRNEKDSHRNKKLLTTGCPGRNCSSYEMSCNSSARLELGPHRRTEHKKNKTNVEEHLDEELMFDMSGASPDHNFKIDDIIQHIFLEVNEIGTTAAGVSATTVDRIAGSKNFAINRPFIFFIRQEVTGTPLFWGAIVDPTNASEN